MDITFTDDATTKIKEILKKESEPSLSLRVFVKGGGCGGFSYGFTLDNEIAEDDFVFENNGIKVLIDSISIQYLTGAVIDFQETLESSQFVIKNPNSKSTCGCGSSFSV